MSCLYLVLLLTTLSIHNTSAHHWWTNDPSKSPSYHTTNPTKSPLPKSWWTKKPTKYPTKSPTKYPTKSPLPKSWWTTKSPTKYPTKSPTKSSSWWTSKKPTSSPTKKGWWNNPSQPECYIGETCIQTADCCSDAKESDRAITCSGNSKFGLSKSARYCCVNNMGKCNDDDDCCGGQTKCINNGDGKKCHNSGQWRALSNALAAWGIYDENGEFAFLRDVENSNGNIELIIPLKYMFFGLCLIILCVVLPCYQCWILIGSRSEQS